MRVEVFWCVSPISIIYHMTISSTRQCTKRRASLFTGYVCFCIGRVAYYQISPRARPKTRAATMQDFQNLKVEISDGILKFTMRNEEQLVCHVVLGHGMNNNMSNQEDALTKIASSARRQH
jgi:hypothetical protein